MNVKASEVVTRLRQIADAIETLGDEEITRPIVGFYCNDSKEEFLRLARALPKPIEKEFTETEVQLWNEKKYQGIVLLTVQAHRSSVCKLVRPAQPAVYDCEPLLSHEEVEAL